MKYPLCPFLQDATKWESCPAVCAVIETSVLAMSGLSYLCRSKMLPGYVPFCSVVHVNSAERVLLLGALAHRERPPFYLPDEE